jgi:hypothetical protein
MEAALWFDILSLHFHWLTVCAEGIWWEWYILQEKQIPFASNPWYMYLLESLITFSFYSPKLKHLILSTFLFHNLQAQERHQGPVRQTGSLMSPSVGRHKALQEYSCKLRVELLHDKTNFYGHSFIIKFFLQTFNCYFWLCYLFVNSSHSEVNSGDVLFFQLTSVMWDEWHEHSELMKIGYDYCLLQIRNCCSQKLNIWIIVSAICHLLVSVI